MSAAVATAADFRAAHDEWARKNAELRIILMTWDEHQLRDVITDSLFRKEDLVEHIIQNDLLADEIDEIIAEYKRENGVEDSAEPVRLCGGAATPKEEHELYQRAMRGEL